MKRDSCAVLGCSPMYFDWGYDEEDEKCVGLKLLMLQQISLLHTKGINRFSVAIDSGFGLYAAEIINGLKTNDPTIELAIIAPYEEQATKWTPDLRNRYFTALAECSEVKYMHPRQAPGCEYEAKMAAIEKAGIAIAIVNSKHPEELLGGILLFMEKARIPVVLIDPDKGVQHSVFQ